MRSDVSISYIFTKRRDDRSKGEILIDSIKEFNVLTVLRMIELIMVYVYKRGRKSKQFDKWNNLLPNHKMYNKNVDKYWSEWLQNELNIGKYCNYLKYNNRWVFIDYGYSDDGGSKIEGVNRWFYSIEIYTDPIQKECRLTPTYYKNERVYGLHNLFYKLINECEKFDSKMLDEILFKVLNNKWKYFEIGSQKDFENRMREVDAITKHTNYRKKWEDEKFDKVWYNESKKEWGKLSDNKMWNNKVKVKVK